MPLAWPTEAPRSGPVRLRPFQDRDVPMVRDLATDAYVPLIGSLPPAADDEQARAWVARQHGRLEAGTGFSFCVADLVADRALGAAGLTLVGPARASAGYATAPAERGRGVAGHALTALTSFAWAHLPSLRRVELYVEPWNSASLAVAHRAGYEREGLLRSHQEIGGRRVDMVLLAALRPA